MKNLDKFDDQVIKNTYALFDTLLTSEPTYKSGERYYFKLPPFFSYDRPLLKKLLASKHLSLEPTYANYIVLRRFSRLSRFLHSLIPRKK